MYGSPNVLEIKEVEKPTPGDHEVLVRVHAATVNRTDCGILSGKPWIIRLVSGLLKPRLRITGTDFAGEVESVGRAVTTFKVGDRVWGLNDNGSSSHAQYLTIAEHKGLATIPNDLTYDKAVASAEGAHYAFNMIKALKVVGGQRILVNGATGAIGSAAVQILKHFGAHVTAVCNTKNIELVKSLGADRVVDYQTQDFTKDHQKYSAVLDAVGKSSFAKCKPLLEPRGVYISTELGRMSQNPFLALITPIASKKKVRFPIPRDIKGSIRFVTELLQKGEFNPVIDRRYPLEDVREAYRYVASGQKTGNVILSLE